MLTLAPPRRPAPPAPAAGPTPVWRAAVAAAVTEHGLPPDGSPATEAEFLAQPGWPLAEWVDGHLDYLPLPTPLHQTVGSHIYDGMRDHLRGSHPGSHLRFTGIPVRIPAYGGVERRGRFPDLALMLDPGDARIDAAGWSGADLTVEIVSPDNPRRDTEAKRADYAAAGVREYWIVDPRPRARTITVLTLAAGTYAGQPVGDGGTAESVLLPGFAVDVTACLGPPA